MRRERLAWGALLLLSCSGRAIDVGPGAVAAAGSNSGAGGTGAVTDTPVGGASQNPAPCTDTTPLPTWPDSSACVPSSNLPLTGTWHGYVEAQSPPWDQISLVIQGASVTGGLCGTLTAGSDPAPAPATDPDAPYPLSDSAPPMVVARGVTSGFAYTLLQGSTDGTRVRFSIAETESWSSWCVLQTPYGPGASCACVPGWAARGMVDPVSGVDICTFIDPAGAQNIVAPCWKTMWCLSNFLCACNSASCTAAQETSDMFDVRVNGDSAEGSNSAGAHVLFTRAK